MSKRSEKGSGSAGPSHGPGNGEGRLRHGHGGGAERDRHGNPHDIDAYLAKLEDPERIAWQKPDEVVRALALLRGDVACDVGAGPGYFAVRMARAVGEEGRVHALDVEPRMIAVLELRLREAGVRNVRPHLVPDGELPAPPETCTAILTVNTFHHFPDRAAALSRLASCLRKGGRLAVVDFRGGELPVGPPPEHRASREDLLAAAGQARLAVLREETFLPYQFFFILAPR